MGTETAVRQQVLQLVKAGVNGKVIAARMGVSESWFSRWLNDTGKTRPLTVSAMDGFRAFVKELGLVLEDAQRVTGADPAVSAQLAEGNQPPRDRREPPVAKASGS